MAVPIVLSLLAAGAGAEPPAVPVLRYEAPANFYHSAITPPDGYESPEVRASVQVYPFRRFSGDLASQFRQTLLRDWIHPMYREPSVAGQPKLGTDTIAGAQQVYTAMFLDGVGHPHVRIVIVVAGLAALVDVSAATNEAWQRAAPAIFPMLQSMRVETAAPPPSTAEGPGAAGPAVAGLYMGYKAKYTTNLNLGPAYGTYTSTLHFYVFSAAGRVYRCYDTIDVPGNDPERFDFDAAQRRDPGNSGRYTVKGGKLYMEIGEKPDTVVVDAPSGGRLKVYDVLYVRN